MSEPAPLPSLAPNEPADWSPLDEALGAARVVMLGEQNHGDGSAFALKAALVRHLHPHHGFDVLAIEACVCSLGRARHLAGSPEEVRSLVPRQVYRFW